MTTSRPCGSATCTRCGHCLVHRMHPTCRERDTHRVPALEVKPGAVVIHHDGTPGWVLGTDRRIDSKHLYLKVATPTRATSWRVPVGDTLDILT